MRPHRALFHLVLRHTVWKVLLLLLLLAAAQWSAFLCLSPDPASIGLADAFSLSGGALAGLLALAFLLLSALLLLATTGRGARRPGYTLARLPLSPGWVVFWQGVYNTLVYLLFWGVQALVLVGIGWYYGRQGGFLGTQTLYVTVWELDLFHFFLPLDLPGRWVSNAALAADHLAHVLGGHPKLQNGLTLALVLGDRHRVGVIHQVPGDIGQQFLHASRDLH